MKKTLLIIASSAALLTLLIFSICFWLISDANKVNLKDYPFVDNNYNNSNIHSKNKVIRIGDSLYYYYSNNNDLLSGKNGLYIINEHKRERLYEGKASLQPNENSFGLDSVDNKLLIVGYYENTNTVAWSENELCDNFFDNLYYMNESNNNIEVLLTPDVKDDIKYFKVINSKLYFFSNKKIYISGDGKHIKPIFNKVDDICNKTDSEKMCYISKNDMYYISNDYKLKKYSFDSKKETVLYDFAGFTDDLECFINLYFYDDQVIIAHKADDSDLFELYSVKNAKLKKVFKDDSEGFTDINSYKDSIFIFNKGLKKYSISSGKIQKLTDSDVDSCYIFDEHYVYYVTNDSVLMRMSQNGGEAEKVFE